MAYRFTHSRLWNTGSPAFAGDDSENYSRGIICPKFCNQPHPRNQRAQGRPGARRTRGLMCDVQKTMLHMSIQVWRHHTGLPCAMALRLIRDRPGDPTFCDTIALGPRWQPSNLTPASGRRTQSISPYALPRSSVATSRPSLPRPAFATMADAPLVGQDGGILTSDFPNLPAIYFFARGWTGFR